MMEKWFRALRSKKGLTLIELIVVVAIIAVLAFTITPRVLTALNNSKTSAARSIANEVHAAMERAYTNQGSAGTAAYPKPTTGTSWATVAAYLAQAEVGNELSNSNMDKAITAFKAFSDGKIYCISFSGNDNPATSFKIQQTGVVETGACTDEKG